MSQQHPALGYWPKGDAPPNIRRTLAYTPVHLGMNRIPPQPDRIIDTMLDLQDESGLRQGSRGFSTMNAVFILLRLPALICQREKEAEMALNRTADAVIADYQEFDTQDRSDTHRYAASVQTLALLSQALLDEEKNS